jgi:hypothetical protein
LTGGSIGWQAGIQSTDLILILRTPSSVRGLVTGKITIGADVAAAAGPVGRNAAAATDAQFQAEIYSYSRSRGLFAGIALDGSSLQIDPASSARYYQAAGAQPSAAQLPASALALLQEITAMTQAPAAAPSQVNLAPGAVPTLESLRQQLLFAAAQLQANLDPNWRSYLAVPAAAVGQLPMNELVGMEQSLLHFDTVAADPRYAAISGRAEFQNTHQLLRQYVTIARRPVSAPAR